jgi:hypothetical protein
MGGVEGGCWIKLDKLATKLARIVEKKVAKLAKLELSLAQLSPSLFLSSLHFTLLTEGVYMGF